MRTPGEIFGELALPSLTLDTVVLACFETSCMVFWPVSFFLPFFFFLPVSGKSLHD